MTTDEIMSRIGALHKTVKLTAFTSRFVYGDDDKIFTVQLEFDDKAGTAVETKASANDFAAALDEAWSKLSDVAAFGLQRGALAPPVEAAAIEPPAPLDDEIQLLRSPQ